MKSSTRQEEKQDFEAERDIDHRHAMKQQHLTPAKESAVEPAEAHHHHHVHHHHNIHETPFHEDILDRMHDGSVFPMMDTRVGGVFEELEDMASTQFEPLTHDGFFTDQRHSIADTFTRVQNNFRELVNTAVPGVFDSSKMKSTMWTVPVNKFVSSEEFGKKFGLAHRRRRHSHTKDLHDPAFSTPSPLHRRYMRAMAPCLRSNYQIYLERQNNRDWTGKTTRLSPWRRGPARPISAELRKREPAPVHKLHNMNAPITAVRYVH